MTKIAIFPSKLRSSHQPGLSIPETSVVASIVRDYQQAGSNAQQTQPVVAIPESAAHSIAADVMEIAARQIKAGLWVDKETRTGHSIPEMKAQYSARALVKRMATRIHALQEKLLYSKDPVIVLGENTAVAHAYMSKPVDVHVLEGSQDMRELLAGHSQTLLNPLWTKARLQVQGWGYIPKKDHEHGPLYRIGFDTVRKALFSDPAWYQDEHIQHFPTAWTQMTQERENIESKLEQNQK